MKKLIARLLVLVMVLSLAACGNNGTTENTTTQSTETTAETSGNDAVVFPEPMTYAEYMAAEVDAPVTVECYVQATQGWWDNSIVIYAQDKDGGYFSYGTACSEEDAAKLLPGTKIQIKGFKAEWDGEVEIVDGSFLFLDETDTFVAEALDITELLTSDELIQHMNKLVAVKGATVKSISYKNDEPGDDIYVTVTVGETDLDLCVEVYLTGTDSEVYTAVGELEVGDVIDVEGFLQWWNALDCHVTKVTKK